VSWTCKYACEKALRLSDCEINEDEWVTDAFKMVVLLLLTFTINNGFSDGLVCLRIF